MRELLLATLLCSACAAAPSSRAATSPPAAPAQSPAAQSPANASAPDQEPTPAEMQVRAQELYKLAEAAEDDLAAWLEAAGALAQASKASADSPREQEFLRSALAAWQKVDKLKSPRSKAPSGQVARTPQPLPDWELARMAVLARLRALTPEGDPEGIQIAYRQARIHYNYDHLEEAAGIYRWIVVDAPESEEAEYAAQLLIDCLAQQQSFSELSHTITSMLADARLVAGRGELKERLEAVRHQADRKSAEKLLEAQDHRGCAELYLALVKRDRSMRGFRADELMYNASVCLERSGQIARTIALLEKLARDMPRSPLAAGAKERAEALRAGLRQDS